MNFKFWFWSFLVGLWAHVGFAQNAVQRQRIVQDYEINLMNSFADSYGRWLHDEKENAKQQAGMQGAPLEILYPNGQVSRLKRIDEYGNLIYIRTYNNTEAARTIGADALHAGGDLDLGLSGEDMSVAVWDAGKVRGTHELLATRVGFGDGADEFDDHATHVAGTLIGGILPNSPGSLAKGIAYQAELESYDWDDDVSEMYTAAGDGLLISNHSYGPDLEQIRNLGGILGKYDEISEAVDQLAYQAPYYTMVIASGNDRNTSYTADVSPEGYNLLAAEMNTAKNNILVTAVYPITQYDGPDSVEIMDFSSFGPTNDYRIKPDLAADGWNVMSSVATDDRGRPSDHSYAYYSGTSSAAPAVAGGVLLLQELKSNLDQGEFLKSSGIRALLIATAHDAGENPGPDAVFGWGLANLEGAAQLLLENANKGDSFMEETLLEEGMEYKEVIEATEEQIKVTIAWTDPPGSPQRRGDQTPRLVNDLDLRLLNSKGEEFYPWRLDENDIKAAARNDGDNAVDNVEQVVIDNVDPGELYTLIVRHKGRLKGGEQEFALVSLGAKPAIPENLEEDGFMVYPNPARDRVNLVHDAKGGLDVEIVDMKGSLLYAEHYANPHHRLTLDVSGYAAGLYFVSIRNEEGKKATKKLLVH